MHKSLLQLKIIIIIMYFRTKNWDMLNCLNRILVCVWPRDL